MVRIWYDSHMSSMVLAAVCRFVPCGEPIYVKKDELCKSHYMQQWNGKPLTEITVKKKYVYLFDEENRLKECTKCGEVKSFDEFNYSPTGKANLQARCRICTRAYSKDRGSKLRRGLTPEAYDALLEKQEGRCAICRTDTPGGHGRWHIDHDHKCCPGRTSCGECVRGLLCNHCNTGLGKFQDSEETLMKAIEYLRLSRQNQQ